MYTFHLFAGGGGGILADLLLGHTPIGAIEIEEYPRKILLQRQLDGILPVFPIWDDVTTFRADNPETRPFIDRLRAVSFDLAICGGAPCQDVSAAGKGAGIEGEQSGLWREMARIVDEIRPRYAFLENSPMLVSRGLTTVLSDLAEIGHDAVWDIVGADDIGCEINHRKRIWLLAYSDKERQQGGGKKEIYRFEGLPWGENGGSIEEGLRRSDIHSPLISRVHDGVANYVERISAIGNGQVPIVAAVAFQKLRGRIK